MTDPLASVRNVLPALERLGEDGRLVASGLRSIIEDGADFDAAMNLPPGWRARDRLARRDDLIRELGTRFGGSINGRAAAVRRDLLRYQATAWRYEKSSKARHNTLLHDIFMLDDNPPSGIRHIVRILSVSHTGPVAMSNCSEQQSPRQANKDASA